MLSVNIGSVSSSMGDYHFLADGAEESGLAHIENTFSVRLAEGSDTPESVDFKIGGLSFTDTDGSDGWSATFNMTDAVESDVDLVVTAMGNSGNDVFTLATDVTLLPEWFYSEDTTWSVTQDADGYDFDVEVSHFSYGFTTPESWSLTMPGSGDPLFDLADMRTGFDVFSTFDIHVLAAGSVMTDNYQFNLFGEVLDETFLDFQFKPSISGSIEINETRGIAHIDGTIAFGGEVAPHFNNDLVCDDVGSELWIDPDLDITIDQLAHANLSLLRIPRAADLEFDLGASINFEKLSGEEHMLTFAPAASLGGFSVDRFEFSPGLDIVIDGDGSLRYGWGFGRVDAYIAAALAQDLSVNYAAATGWELSAPGSFALDGRAHYETFWGRGPRGDFDFAHSEIASWDFLSDERELVLFGVTVA